jgi:hypothetical protein
LPQGGIEIDLDFPPVDDFDLADERPKVIHSHLATLQG